MDDILINISSKSSSSLVRPIGVSEKNKEMCEKSTKEDLFTQKKSFLIVTSRSCDNSAEPGSLSSAMAVQRKRKPFVCDICKKSFDTKQNLGCHIRIHYNDRPFKCGECGISFKWESTKIEHELRHLKHQKEIGRDKKKSTKKCYVCEICEKEYQTKMGLYNHSNLHKNKYLCTFCGRRCASKANLIKHLRIHTKEKPFSCEVCKRTFNLKNDLKRHLTTHSDDCPFHCNVCDKTFKTKHQKCRHELFHLRGK